MRDTHTTAEIFEPGQDKDTIYFGEGSITADDPAGLQFPIEVFPEPFRGFIIATHDTLNMPPDYTGLSLLVAVSTVIGNTARIEVKSNWHQPPIIFAGLVGNPGTSKTHALNLCLSPFEDDDRREMKRFIEDAKNYKKEVEAYKRKKGKKNGDDDDEPPIEPTPLQTIVFTESTPEAQIKHLQGNRRGGVVKSDELATYFETLTQYSKGNNASFLLSLYNATSITQLRIGETLPRNVDSPFCNIIGGIQPRILREVFTSRTANNGFVLRFLWAYPDHAEKQPINNRNLDPAELDKLNRWFREAKGHHQLHINSETDKIEPNTYTLSPEAFALYCDLHAQNTQRVISYGDSIEAEMLCKFDDHLVRLCLILHIMENPLPHQNEVQVESLEKAAALCEYFMHTAKKVLNLISGKGPVLHQKQADLISGLPDVFTTADAIAAGKQLTIPESTVKSWLSNYQNSLFSKVDHGIYKKLS